MVDVAAAAVVDKDLDETIVVVAVVVADKDWDATIVVVVVADAALDESLDAAAAAAVLRVAFVVVEGVAGEGSRRVVRGDNRDSSSAPAAAASRGPESDHTVDGVSSPGVRVVVVVAVAVIVVVVLVARDVRHGDDRDSAGAPVVVVVATVGSLFPALAAVPRKRMDDTGSSWVPGAHPEPEPGDNTGSSWAAAVVVVAAVDRA